jgi:hypothetical protein
MGLGCSRVSRKRHTVLMDFIGPEKLFLRSFSPVVVNRWRFGSHGRRTLEPERKGNLGLLALRVKARSDRGSANRPPISLV